MLYRRLTGYLSALRTAVKKLLLKEKLPPLLRRVDGRVLAAAVLALIAAVILTAALISRGAAGARSAAVVSVDIEPGVELSVNKYMRVIDVAFINAQDTAAPDTRNLISKKLNDALSTLYRQAGQNGYRSEGRVVLISAAPYASETDERFVSRLREFLDAFKREAGPDVFTVYVDDPEVVSQARQAELTIGKYLLYKYAEEKGYGLTVRQIRSATVNGILTMLNVRAEDIAGGSADTQAAAAAADASEDTLSAPAQTGPSPAKPGLPPRQTANDAFDPRLTVTVTDGTLKFAWTPVPDAPLTYDGAAYDGFLAYKIVASQTDPTPSYPENGYIHEDREAKASDWLADPAGSGYNRSPKLEPGVKYYFAVTYVFENGLFTSNTVSLTVPEFTEQPAETAPAFSEPELSVTVSGDTLYFNWTPLPGKTVIYDGTTYEGFKYARVTASKDNPAPVYPDDGYLYYAADPSTSSWSVTPALENYNKQPRLKPSETYYFAVTYVFENGKFVTNTVTATIPDDASSATPPA
jgi:hypothetical protein